MISTPNSYKSSAIRNRCTRSSGASLIEAAILSAECEGSAFDTRGALTSRKTVHRCAAIILRPFLRRGRSRRERRVSTLAMDLIPRITRAQAMDALSSQATVAGYKAVLLGASHLSKLCPMLMTAAGTIPAARAVIFGAGVAGLQAIATAKRLGCVVEA